MNKCKCGAEWKINYPFGKKSKARTTFLIKHKSNCEKRKNTLCKEYFLTNFVIL